ncbi:MAG: stage II sporulation protein R [Clostridiales bacterium]|nr:stage II sporulation protein R [Clostridiales bacterium]
MKKIIAGLAAILIIAALVPMLPTAEDADIYNKTVRLHVIANSDSQEDQALKLKVRDAILTKIAPLLEGTENKEDAENILRENIDLISQTAQQTVYEEGFDNEIHIDFDREYYPRREYEAVTLPAGHYLSMQVKIGENKGQNWWCVLFPMLCTTSAKPEEELTQAGFTVNQIRLITDSDSTRYKIKFKFLEIFDSFKK